MRRLFEFLKNKKSSHVHVTGLRTSAAAYLAANTVEKLHRPLLCIVPSEGLLSGLELDISLFTDVPVIVYPGYEIPPYTPLSPDSSTTASRLSALYRVLNAHTPFILIASCEALFRKIPPLKILNDHTELLIAGEEIEQNNLITSLVNSGYEEVSLVQSEGEFTVKGGIVDIYPPLFDSGNNTFIDAPVRLDFFGDTIESIRHFDPITQRSISEIEEAVILPVKDTLFPNMSENGSYLLEQFDKSASHADWAKSEQSKIKEKLSQGISFPGIEFLLPLFYDSLSCPVDVLPDNTSVFLFEPSEIKQTAQLTWERIQNNFLEASTTGTPALSPDTLFLNKQNLHKILEKFTQVSLHDFTDFHHNEEESISFNSGNHILVKQQLDLGDKKTGLIAPLAQYISDWFDKNDKVALACRSLRHARHLSELFLPYGFDTQVIDEPLAPDNLNTGTLYLCSRSLTAGFDLTDDRLHVLSDRELFGEKRPGPKKRKKEGDTTEPVTFEQLHIDDYIVHAKHGIGIFKGIHHIIHSGIGNDFLELTYRDGDKLYVPVDRMNNISKYHGVSDKSPKIEKLGGKNWEKIKKKVKDAVWKVAQDLLDLYARRKLATSTNFSRPGSLYQELEETFPFHETSGQNKAINDVINDLASEQTMDRLVCGDVGYGKTEVAIRAAFKVVEDGFQAAILVPTTVLAEQHVLSFRERLSCLPVRVESLNRFKSTKEQKEIIKDLGAGKVDIVIGTHRLLSKDVNFAKLGLLIIDEEHRFGVTHKEKLKKLKTNIDVLTLTATPIPRTLQMSLLGVRDLSIISSPPRHRRSIKTFIARQDDLVIKEAVVKELQRKGQVFLVHNRVRSINELALKTQKLVPHAKIAVAHGQMPAKQLEEIMVRFTKKEIDVLVSTTIIESGLDIPSANTIIITRADRFGLAEIYQLRGRVGRSNEQAFAYLLVPSLDGLSKDARQRLRALMDYNELGGGFKLAMSDLQIRGGGNILGESQSGNIAAVGYDLYLDLLQKTVEDLKRRAELGDDYAEDEDVDPELNLQISAFIPDSYIYNTDQRYIAYRQITSLPNEDALTGQKDELRDRYGPLPTEVTNLLQVISLKLACKKLKISKLDQGKDILAFSFLENTSVEPEKILTMVKNSKGKARFTPDGKLVVKGPLPSPETVFPEIKKILQALI
jgi:transcription-repair coupling factor (superfamily II helicase)